ncbi:MAG TPA: VOC family protein [Pseudogracilibacillus sp.]|nr:VOC family protein [Pseudogracilibacillus sp.]
MIERIEHTAIIVRDMKEALKFYCDTLGFTVRLQSDGGDRKLAFLYLDKASHTEIELIQDVSGSNTYHKDGVVNHIAFAVNNIEETIHYLQKKGVSLSTDDIKKTVDGGKMILFYGPNDELLQLVQRNN